MLVGLIKAVHVALFLLLAAGSAYVAFCGATGRAGRLRSAAILACSVELAVLALNGWVCPLTQLAERLGARSGSVADLFLPEWSMRFVFPAFGAVFGIGLALIVGRTLARSR